MPKLAGKLPSRTARSAVPPGTNCIVPARVRAHPDTLVGGDMRAVAADVSPWQGSSHPANCHRLTSAVTVVGPSGDVSHNQKMRPIGDVAPSRKETGLE